MSDTPIADYALISDCHSAALVSTRGSVDWLCFPRFDKPSVFGRLLDQNAGHWTVRPTESARVTRRYLDQTMVLETAVRSASGASKIIDAMALDPSDQGHDLGAGAPGVVIRRIECLDGQMEFQMEYAPRPRVRAHLPFAVARPGGRRGTGGARTFWCSRVPLSSIWTALWQELVSRFLRATQSVSRFTTGRAGSLHRRLGRRRT